MHEVCGQFAGLECSVLYNMCFAVLLLLILTADSLVVICLHAMTYCGPDDFTSEASICQVSAVMSNCHIHCLTVTFNSVVDIVIYFSSICSSDKIPARMSHISGPTLDTFWPLLPR